MVNFLSFLVIGFDPANRFLCFKKQDTPNFKGFPMVYILFAISHFLVWDKTGFHDEIKNQIDVKTETLISQNNNKESEILNDLRSEQLEAIEEIKKKNLSHVDFDEDAYKTKWTHIIDDSTLTFDQKIDIIKGAVILYDCVLIDDANFKSNISL